MIKQEKFNNAIENNDIEIISILLNDKQIDPTMDKNWAIRYCSKYGYIDIVKLLLKDKRVSPSDHHNDAIDLASENGHINIIKLLWSCKSVKNTLNKNNLILYNQLIKQDIKNKISKF